MVTFHGKARYDLAETCCFCLWFINEGDYYEKNVNGKSAHYSCAHENGWRWRVKRKKVIEVVKKSVSVPRAIKVIKKGEKL